MTDVPDDLMLNGLMARGITREQAEEELREIKRDLADMRRPEWRRQFRYCMGIFMAADRRRRARKR